MDPLLSSWVLLIGIVIGLLIGIGLTYTLAVKPLHLKLDTLQEENELQPENDQIISTFDETR